MPIIEPSRPVIHFTAPKGWLNDPNGLVYSKGIYHLFYQHNPFGTQWGNMTWGHATSKDLIRWVHKPNAISPDALGTIFSGSAVVDRENVAGFGKDALIGFYTSAGNTSEESKGRKFTQSMFWSPDGINFSKLKSNPVISHIVDENRDPKVIWYAPKKVWVMTLYLTGDQYAIFNSKDLKNWHEVSRFNLKNSSECPDLFQVPVENAKSKKKWVFWGANGFYQVGEFDGQKFSPETGVLQAYHGNTAYAAQTYSNAPKGRCIQISWFRGSEFPGEAWNQQMGFPNQLSLVDMANGPRLKQLPVEEIKSTWVKTQSRLTDSLKSESGVFDFEGSWRIPATGQLELMVNGLNVKFNATDFRLKVMDSEVQVGRDTEILNLRIIADKASVEIYVDGGLTYMPFYRLMKSEDIKGIEFVTGSDWGVKLRMNEIHL